MRTSSLRKLSKKTRFLIFVFLLFVFARCQKEEYNAPLMLKVHFSTQKTSDASKSADASQFLSVKDQISALKSTKGTKSVIADGAHYTIYGVGVTGFWWTEPLTAVNWQITNPAIGLDTTINSQEMMSFKFKELGVYAIRAFSTPPYGFNWNMTLSVLSSLDEALIVSPDFIRSEYISATNVFRYYWRVQKPVVFSGTETLFRTFGLSQQTYNPFPVFYNQVSFYGADSIEWYYDLAPNGLTAQGAKSNVGYVNSAASEIWLTIDTASIWRCQDPVDNNVVEAIHYNGQVGPLGTNFNPPADVQTGAGDYGQTIPIVLVGSPTAGSLPLYIMSEPETNRWRHRLASETDWTELVTTPQPNGRVHIVLPAHPSFEQRIVQLGHIDNGTFVPDSYMSLSSMYNPTFQGFSIAY